MGGWFSLFRSISWHWPHMAVKHRPWSLGFSLFLNSSEDNCPKTHQVFYCAQKSRKSRLEQKHRPISGVVLCGGARCLVVVYDFRQTKLAKRVRTLIKFQHYAFHWLLRALFWWLPVLKSATISRVHLVRVLQIFSTQFTDVAPGNRLE